MSVLAVTGSTESDIPSTWNIVGIEDIAAVNPRIDAAGLDGAGQVHFIPMSAVEEDFGGIDTSRLRPLAEVRKGYTWFVEDDVLLAKITPCMENGKGALVPHLEHGHAFGSTEFHVLRPNGATSSKWLAHYLSQPEFRRVARQNMTGSAGQLRVPTNWLANAGIPVAPFAEQTRIVEKLEELLSDLDAGVAELKAAQHKLAQYRQSLLKAAVEGALTADWRAARADKLPPPLAGEGWGGGGPKPVASPLDVPPSQPSPARGGRGEGETGAELLQRILIERRARWEAKQLAKFVEQGKTPPKDWQVKYPEPVAPDITDLPALPEGWVWACAEQLCEFITKGTTPPKDASTKEEKTVPFLRVTNLTNAGSLDLLDRVYVSKKTHLGFLARSVVYPGDVLMNIVGPPLGQVSVVPDDFEQWNINQAIAIFRPVVGMSSQFICAALLSNPVQKWLKKRAKTTAGQTNLTLEICRALPLPLAPRTEQDFLIEALGSQLEEQARQSASVEHGLKQATAQRKNLLKAAFAGQLVAQDPNDEPANVLLERIRAKRDNPEHPSMRARRTKQPKRPVEPDA